MSRQVVLDTETTGLSAETGDRVVEIGCVELIDRQLSGNHLHQYVNPERDSEEDAQRIHGISNEFLREQPRFAEVADRFIDFIRDAELIIHNAPFDVGFLDMELERAGRPPLSSIAGSVVDTLALAKQRYPGKRNSLDALCERLGVDNSSRTLHGALLDAELLADVYIYLTRGQETLPIDVAVGDHEQRESIDLSRFELPVLLATEQEARAHDAVLSHIDEASSGATIWRQAADPL